MTTIKSMKQTIHLNIPNTDTIDVSLIYSRLFFDIFNLKGYRVYKRGSTGNLIETNDKLPNLPNYKKNIDIPDFSNIYDKTKVKHKFRDILGEEQPNNGYDILPIKKLGGKSKPVDNESETSTIENPGLIDKFKQYFSSSEKEESENKKTEDGAGAGYENKEKEEENENTETEDGTGDENKDAEDGYEKEEENGTEIGVIDSWKQYISRFLGNNNTTMGISNPLEGIMVSFPNDIMKPIVSLDNLYTKITTSEEYIFQFSNSDVTYEFVENILRDLYIQIDYLKQIGMTYKNVTVGSVYRIQERFIILDSSLLEPFKNETMKEQEEHLNNSIVTFISKIIGKEEEANFDDRFREIQDTRVYYVLKRMESEKEFEWI